MPGLDSAVPPGHRRHELLTCSLAKWHPLLEDWENMSAYQPSLHLYVVFRPAEANNQSGPDRLELAQRLYCHFCRDAEKPLLRGLGIPVFFRSAPEAGGAGLPLGIELE